jgi:hypothetical protein
MSRPRYSILPLQDKDGTWVYLFRDNDLTHRTNGGPVQYGVACHYDGEKRNWTKTLDPIEAIEICGDLNEQAAEWEKEQRLVAEADALAYVDKISRNKTKPSKGFWPWLLRS